MLARVYLCLRYYIVEENRLLNSIMESNAAYEEATVFIVEGAFERGEGMTSVEVAKERARIAGRFNLSARRNPEHRALVALAAQKAGGECQMVPAAPGEDTVEVLRRARKVAGGKPVIIVTETDGELHARLFDSESN